MRPAGRDSPSRRHGWAITGFKARSNRHGPTGPPRVRANAGASVEHARSGSKYDGVATILDTVIPAVQAMANIGGSARRTSPGESRALGGGAIE
jgi:hypothetical protein